ncbi:MAG: hypothetical protein IPK81_14135 [Rhodospirillales bacterium]|nr:MAG: hypothetical protein IPK81_14135 [Rhodospirillales bacterium]
MADFNPTTSPDVALLEAWAGYCRQSIENIAAPAGTIEAEDQMNTRLKVHEDVLDDVAPLTTEGLRVKLKHLLIRYNEGADIEDALIHGRRPSAAALSDYRDALLWRLLGGLPVDVPLAPVKRAAVA